MRYYSDTTKKIYNTEDELKKAEQAALEAQKEREEKESKRKEERAARAKEIEAARKDYMEARKIYNDLIDQFVKDYGSFHYTITDTTDSLADSLSRLWDFWF